MKAIHPLRPWFMWATGAAFFYFAFFQRTAPSVMVPELMRDFSVTAAALGNLSAFYFWSYTAVQLPTGVLADRWGPRRLLTASALFAGAGGLLFATADGLAMTSLGRLMVGAAAGFAFVCTLKISTDWFPPHRMGLLSGLLMMAGMLGGVSGQAPLAAAIAGYGWRASMSVIALAVLGVAVAAWLIVRDKPPAAEGTAAAARPHESVLAGLRRCLGRSQTWYVAGFGFFLLPPMFAFGALWGVPYLTQVHGFSRPEAAFAASLILLGWGICAPVVGWLSDRWRRRKAPMVVAASLNCLCMTSLIYGPAWSPAMVYAILFANGMATAGMVGLFVAVREHNAARDAGAAMAFANMAVIGCGAFFQPLTGWLLDQGWTGEMAGGVRVYTRAAYDGAFWVVAASPAVATVMALLVKETHAKPQVD
ncbi:MAG: MFS transporter [Magnetovibrio sp.]|nr:MFS transporter [Magnetovibrio sp.]